MRYVVIHISNQVTQRIWVIAGNFALILGAWLTDLNCSSSDRDAVTLLSDA